MDAPYYPRRGAGRTRKPAGAERRRRRGGATAQARSERKGAVTRARIAAALALVLAAPAAVRSEEPLTLEKAIAEALAANARLPIPALDVSLAAEREREAKAERWLKVALESDFIYAPPGYSAAITNLGEARLQGVVRQPVYAGGALKAGVDRALANKDAAAARYRMAQKDVELEVRGRFAELAAARTEIDVRRTGLDQLSTYMSSLRSRQAAGQGVTADLLKTSVRVELEQATVADAEQRADEARLGLNELMGRDPAAPLTLAPLPPPGEPKAIEDASWNAAPDIGAAQAEAHAAEAQITIASAERRPHLLFSADAGFLADDTTHPFQTQFWDRVWRDGGYSLSLVFSWPVWDTGAAQARVAQASIEAEQANRQVDLEKRNARLAWEKARSALRRLYDQIQILSKAIPDARDSYLDTESRYRGGTATNLEVLDAHAAAVDAGVRLSDAVERYRVAEASLIRWGTP
ncbi:MAG TPA: TolC family protein [Thermoanaerobaculia bacterium]|nr:TolC family protein [Thermoanaerobaculia bacterium]